MAATTQLAPDSVVMTDEAQELLDCFVSGLDAVIYELSESAAKTRLATSGKSESPVIIETSDVLWARETLMAFLSAEVKSGRLSEGVLSAFDEMKSCCDTKLWK